MTIYRSPLFAKRITVLIYPCRKNCFEIVKQKRFEICQEANKTIIEVLKRVKKHNSELQIFSL